MEDVLTTLNSKELKKRTEGTKEEAGDGLYVRGMSDHSGKAHSGGSSRFMSRGGTSKLKCFICHSEGHLKRDCPNKKSSGFVKKGKRDQDSDSSDDEGNAYFREALMVVENDEMTELVMDSGGSYHMTHNKDFLYDFKVVDGGSIQLDKNCQKVKIQLHDGSSFILEDVRLNIKKLDGNIVQKHGGSKQVGFKQLGPGVETGVHGVHDEKRVWFEVELQGAQGDREAEVFQVSNDDTAVAQRRLEDKQPEEKTNTDCLVKEQEKEYQTGWKIKTGNVLDSCNQRSTQQCMKSGVAKHLGVAGIQQQNGLVDETNVTLFAKVRCFLIQSGLSKVFWAEDTTRSTYLVNRSPSSAIGFKKPIDMLGFFGWLASIKQGMLEPVKVKCIFLGYHKSIVGNKLWRLDDVTSKVVLYRNMGFNESGEYKKTFIGSGVGTGSIQVLHGFEFEVELLGDHTFKVEPQENVNQGAEDSNEAAFAVAAVEKIYAHESLTFNNTVACEVISKWKAGLKDDMDARSNVYVLSNDDMVFSCECKAEIWATKGLLDKAKGNVLGMEIVRDQSGNTIRVSQSRFYNEKLVQTLLEGYSKLSLEGSLSGDCDAEKNGKWSCIYAVGSQEYQMVCTRLDIASADVGMLDRFDRGLQTNVQVFVDFDYTLGRSITVMGRSITRYELMIQGCAGSREAMMLHMMVLSPTKAGYMTLTKAAKEAIWLKGLAIESGFELKIVAGIAIGDLSKAIPGPRFQHKLNLLSIGIG
ncbi:zinc finger, CCHC-type containing protein [Tanacetum coccineum]